MMYDTIYTVNLLLFKNRHIKSTTLRFHKNRKEAKTKGWEFFNYCDTVYDKKLFGIQE